MAVSLASFACASEHGFRLPLTRESRAELADLLPKDAEVTWREGDGVSREAARSLSLAGGVVTWVPADRSETRKAPEAALRSIDWVSRTRGAGHGALIGGIGAGVILAALLAASGDSRCGGEVYFCINATAAEKGVAGAVGGFLVGGLLGTLAGVAIGSHQHVEFVAEPAR